MVHVGALLAVADGRSVHSTARECRTYPNTVAGRHDRFIADGVDGVRLVAPGRGRKPEISSATVEVMENVSLHTVPADGSTSWTSRTLAAKHGFGKDTVVRILRVMNLRPWQVDTFKLSNDTDFEARLVDVVGLHLDPPEGALVFSFDEKTQCQAHDRTQPSLPIKPGRGKAITHHYERHRSVDLFAAMNIVTAEVLHYTRRRHAGGDVLTFLKLIDLHDTSSCTSCSTTCEHTSTNRCVAGSPIRTVCVGSCTSRQPRRRGRA